MNNSRGYFPELLLLHRILVLSSLLGSLFLVSIRTSGTSATPLCLDGICIQNQVVRGKGKEKNKRDILPSFLGAHIYICWICFLILFTSVISSSKSVSFSSSCSSLGLQLHVWYVYMMSYVTLTFFWEMSIFFSLCFILNNFHWLIF